MKHWIREAARVAAILEEELAEQAQGSAAVPLPTADWNALQKTCRQMALARQLGWRLAGTQLQKRFSRELEQLTGALQELSRHMDGLWRKSPDATRCEILKDLVALRAEFADVRWDRAEHCLAVTTDAIELQGVELGSFEIRLDWKRLQTPAPYEVIALEANRPAFSSSVTHPHVQDDQLCEGEGRTAIRAALAQGRFFDFFLLVSRVLSTYSPDSAYASLRDWYGTPCHDCGGSTDEDDSCACERCEETICSACCSSCESCGRSQCSSCIFVCPDCGQPYCPSCLELCTACRKDVCAPCLEEGLCHECQQDQESASENATPVAEEPEVERGADLAFHAHGLGQAALPAGSGTN